MPVHHTHQTSHRLELGLIGYACPPHTPDLTQTQTAGALSTWVVQKHLSHDVI